MLRHKDSNQGLSDEEVQLLLTRYSLSNYLIEEIPLLSSGFGRTVQTSKGRKPSLEERDRMAALLRSKSRKR